MRILIVEDEARIASNIRRFLEKVNFTVDIVHNSEDALIQGETEDYDLIILDWMLPDMEGTAVCERLKKKGISTPIIMLTARVQIDDKLEGFSKGADDYLTKPFEMSELLARVKALIRRKDGSPKPHILEASDLTLDTNTCQVKRGGRIIELAPKEYALLEYLLFNKGRVIDRLTLLDHVWGGGIDEFSNTVDVHIRYLRQKIDVGYPLKLIKTVVGKGYMLCED